LLVIGYGAKIRWVAMRVKAENRMVTFIITKFYIKYIILFRQYLNRQIEQHRSKTK